MGADDDEVPLLQLGERIGQYKVLQKPGGRPLQDGELAEPLGRGGSAPVFFVEQQIAPTISIKRALKISAPKNKILKRRAAADQSEGTKSFLDEIAHTSQFTHQNLVKIIDAGQQTFKTNLNRTFSKPYYVMEFIKGAPLGASNAKDAWSRVARRDPFLILRLAQQIAWPLRYLHGQQFYHFDIKPDNIFISEVDGRPHITLADLGVGRVIERTIVDKDPIFISGTKRFTPPIMLPHLNTEVSPEFLKTYAAHWDLYGFAETVLATMRAWRLSAEPELRALKLLLETIRKFDQDLNFETVSSELDRLLPAHVITAGVEELSTDAAGKKKYISLPLYAAPVSDRVEEILDHPSYSRLQLVPQLLLVRSVLPGGVHTLYEHILGSYTLLTRAVSKLLSYPEFRARFSSRQIEEAMLAILLIRVGSFQLDKVFWTVADRRQPTLGKVDVINMFLDRQVDGETLRQRLQRCFPAVQLANVLSIIAGEKKALEGYGGLIHGLIRSSIDVRVMDFLVRDSYHSGIPPGLGVDVPHIIDSLAWTRTNNSVGINPNGVFSVEHLLAARYWMFCRVYWNKQNRAVASMLRYIVYQMMEVGALTSEYFVKEMMDLDEAGALRVLRNTWRFAVSSSVDETSILDLLQQSRPRVYKVAIELFAKNWVPKDDANSVRLTYAAAGWNARDLDNLRNDFFNRSQFRSRLRADSILFDVPNEVPRKLGEDVYVQLGRNEERLLGDISPIVQALSRTFDESAIRLRAFHHPKIPSKLLKSLAGELREFLTEKADATSRN